MSLAIQSRGINYLRNLSRKTVVIVSSLLAGAVLVGGLYAVSAVPPNAPADVVATAGNGQVVLTWTASEPSDVNEEVYDYTVEYKASSSGTWIPFDDGASAEPTATVTGLTNGTAYDFRLYSVDNGEDVTISDPSAVVSATPFTVPNAPTAVTVASGNGAATVSFTAPANNGGSAITGYTVTSSPGGFTNTGTTSPITVAGLANGTAYTFTVVATNAAGSSAASTASAAVTPATVPGVPTAVTAVRGDTQASISFTPPASTGGSAITNYTVTSSPGGVTATGTASPIIVTGLTNGTAYTFTVVATNLVGTGASSAASAAVTPAGNPGTPTGLAATAGDGQVGLSWTAPAANGTAIIDYTIERSLAGANVWTTFTDGTSAATTASVTGLTNGTAYDFRVTAVNAVGSGSASTSVASTPRTVSGAPTSPVATPGNASASVSFVAPADNGGSPITGYTVTSTPGGFTGTGTGSPITVSGLTNGTSYTFVVTATNAAGDTSSVPTAAVTPRTTPGAPTSVTAVRGNGQATVSFTAPASNGGAPITSYTVTSNNGITATGTASPIVVTGLTNGTAYTFTVVANNVAGPSAASSASAAVTPATVPLAPTSPTVTVGDGSAVVSFVAPYDGGSAITGYTVTSSPGGITATGTASPITVTGLTNGSTYTFTVTATNAVGTSVASQASLGATPLAAPSTPTNLVVVNGDTEAFLRWTAPTSTGGSPITDYVIEFSLAGENDWSTFVDGVSTDTTATVTGLTNGTAYDFRVSAVTAAGVGAASVSASATPVLATPAPVVGAPNTGLKPTSPLSMMVIGFISLVSIVLSIVFVRRYSLNR